MDDQFFSSFFSNYAKCYDEFNLEGLVKYYFTPTLMVKNGLVLLYLLMMKFTSTLKVFSQAIKSMVI